ncbi:WD40-repeat-containing domain protein [Chaetomium strumarium]|uniref:WD40-repeat-containing domain protein n=1 Tax=Chaetomium strumarium TaxID=1170767 RepID=A0AAJ0GYY9_9PEZI|nr:WD40-repeat-containing domain protein [Chaetomium strumarium]
MPSFFTAPGAQKKRKRPTTAEAPKKRLATTKTPSKSTAKAPTKPTAAAKKKAIERDESISGSDLESDESGDDVGNRSGSDAASDDSDSEGETAAEKRLRLAQRYLEKTRKEVELEDEYAFDAEEIDRDLLAERLQEDVAEAKGKAYRRLAFELNFGEASYTQFRWNSGSVTSVAVCAPYAYTTTKDGYLTKWKLQDLPKNQWPQTTRRKPKKPPAPPKRKPERICFTKANPSKTKDKTYQGHTGAPLVVRASQDGKYVVTGGADSRLVVYNAADLKPIRAFKQHRDAVISLAFRRGTNQLYSGSKDRSVKVWSLDELAYVQSLFGHRDEIPDIDALAQERCVSVGARDRTAHYWKVADEQYLIFRGGGEGGSSSSKKHKLPPNIDPASAAHQGSMDRISMIDEEHFVTGSDNGDLALWSIQRKKPLHTVPRAHGIEPPLKPEQVSADEVPNPKDIPAPQPRGITALRALPYSDVILTGSWDGYVRVWRLSEDKRKIEPVGVLGGSSSPPAESSSSAAAASSLPNGTHTDVSGEQGQDGALVRGIVNDIAMFERGERGRDGLCVVAVTGKEMRFGRWKYMKEGRCGAVIFEVPRVDSRKQKQDEAMANGVSAAEGEDE